MPSQPAAARLRRHEAFWSGWPMRRWRSGPRTAGPRSGVPRFDPALSFWRCCPSSRGRSSTLDGSDVAPRRAWGRAGVHICGSAAAARSASRGLRRLEGEQRGAPGCFTTPFTGGRRPSSQTQRPSSNVWVPPRGKLASGRGWVAWTASRLSTAGAGAEGEPNRYVSVPAPLCRPSGTRRRPCLSP
jgi:hypothetical protein